MIDINKIYNEDCLATLSKMEDDYIDLTITSPPYNVDLGNNKFNTKAYNQYKDDKSHQEYLTFLKNIFIEIYHKTKGGGRCIINIGDGKNGKIPTHSDIIQFMIDIGWIPMTIIVWDKNNVSSRTAWGSFCSPSSPSFPCPFEYILVFAKETYTLQYKGESDLTKDDFIKWSLAKWSFTGESRKKIGHPAPFPLELPIRCLKMFSWKNAIIYDPFMGSGTTAVACLQNNRNFIGSEISKEYCEIAENRMKEIRIRNNDNI